MDTPFVLDGYVTGKNNIGRQQDAAILANLLSQGENVSIYEPPKSGKMSLIQQTFFNMKASGRQFNAVHLSLLGIRDDADFIVRYGNAMLQTAGTTAGEYADAVSRYLPGTHFVFDPQQYMACGELLSLNWEMDEFDVKAVLRLPFTIAEDRQVRYIVTISEFQNIMLLESGETFRGYLEEAVVHAGASPSATFIFSGSQVNAMKRIFEVERFCHHHVEHMPLSAIDSKTIAEHISKSYLISGKVVQLEHVSEISERLRNNIWYLNQIGFLSDSMSKGYITPAMLEDALNVLTASHEPQFLTAVSDLTTFQTRLLRAILDGNVRLSSSEVIRKYGLNSSANVHRLKDALCKKEIVTFDENDNPSILDPLFELWLRTKFFA